MEKELTIVINTFNSEDKINDCLSSIASNHKVIVVENSSNLNFKKKIEETYKNVECILTNENLGYAKGNNLGLSKVKTNYALVLNPDAKLGKNTVENFFITANKIKDFSLIGPAKQDEYRPEVIENTQKELVEVNSIKGFAMFFNLKQFNDIGFFDENFFIYLEEIDLCKRLINKGKKIYLDKKIIVEHLGGSSHNESLNFEMELSRNWHWMWSTFYYNKKHNGFLISLFLVGPKLISSLLKFFLFLILKKKEKKEIYFHRYSGLINSISGKTSWYRPKV